MVPGCRRTTLAAPVLTFRVCHFLLVGLVATVGLGLGIVLDVRVRAHRGTVRHSYAHCGVAERVTEFRLDGNATTLVAERDGLSFRFQRGQNGAYAKDQKNCRLQSKLFEFVNHKSLS